MVVCAIQNDTFVGAKMSACGEIAKRIALIRSEYENGLRADKDNNQEELKRIKKSISDEIDEIQAIFSSGPESLRSYRARSAADVDFLRNVTSSFSGPIPEWLPRVISEALTGASFGQEVLDLLEKMTKEYTAVARGVTVKVP